MLPITYADETGNAVAEGLPEKEGTCSAFGSHSAYLGGAQANVAIAAYM